jgi:hypothetical protein
MSRPPYEDLSAELRALSGSDLLSKDQVSRALARLEQDEQDRSMIVRRRTERAFAEGRGDVVARDHLRWVLTPERSLGEINEVTVVLTRVELWASRLILRLEARQSALTDALDATFDTEWKAWERTWVEDRATAEADDLPPPEWPSVPRLSELPLSVADDVGTRYHAIGMSTGGSEHRWRSEWRLEPEVPLSAAVLRIALEDGAPARDASSSPCLRRADALGESARQLGLR